MKKYIKIAIILLTSGLVLFLIGFTTNGFSMPKSNETVNGKITQRYTKNLDKFNAIDINSNIPINIKQSSNPKISVELNKTQDVNYNVDDGVLKINGNGNEWYHNFFRIGFLNNFNRKNSTNITLYVPDKESLKYINQSEKHSRINISDITVEKPLKLNSVNSIYNVKAPSIDVESSNNDMSIEHSSFNDDNSYIEADNGDSYIYSNTFQKLNIESENGDMSIRNNKSVRGFSKLENENGDIDLGNNSWYSLELSNENGDITFGHQDIKHIFNADSENGDIEGEINSKDNANIHTSSENGDSTVMPGLSHSNSPKKYKFTNENGDVTIQ
ncbi:DUF4097 family beta strand repeat-containing protein [Apilactobacillus quenuiae]|uniref:DUF4097 family beta strand repeat-containing protein n=1 Tax=Apilactobacillus quenuiae TaxID=2008377 RepID=UPI000D012155|nr:DUF4097 family beta strand repeat-containing protein [Apilactobacillus quenuiae]